ncbi:MAG TPA: hypothetical protein VNH84_11420 [Candidatus Saccharimonadales bacterium]|nr:hypothetical protein [Candidatus Saccharimonadales bacterium]
MRLPVAILSSFLQFGLVLIVRAEAPAGPRIDWNTLAAPSNDLKILRIDPAPSLPAGATRMLLPTPAPNLVAAWWVEGSAHRAIPWLFNHDATRLELELPPGPSPMGASVALEISERTTQFPDGRIVFSALDAQVQGRQARLESHPGNHRIGFWTDPTDTVSWNYQPTRWGRYDVALCYAAEGGDGTEVEVEVGGRRLRAVRPSTGSWYRYTTLPVGRVYLANSDPFTLRVGCSRPQAGAVMNLKAVVLRPAPEGEPIVQAASGVVTLAARDAITHGTHLRYEPATNKNCLGYWTQPRDWAEWEFTVNRPGEFRVEVWQGCGKGQGGSEVMVEAGGARLSFTVEDTGHFQNFVPRQLGTVTFPATGVHTLAIRPQKKKAAAIMDIRQVLLLPAGVASK